MESERIAVLEAQLARLQRVTVMIGAGFLLLLVWRLVPPSPTVEARQFLMRDRAGVVRGALMMLDDGRPTLRLNDKNGKARTMLYLNPERGGGLRFTDMQGYQRLQLTLSPAGSPEIRLDDPEDQAHTWISLVAEDRPAVTVAGAGGRAVWASPLP